MAETPFSRSLTRERQAFPVSTGGLPGTLVPAVGVAVNLVLVGLVVLSFQRLGSTTPSGGGPLPMVLVAGWEAAGADPPAGVAAIGTLTWLPSDPMSDPAPRAEVRWYRVRFNLPPGAADKPLAFAARGLRDVDETYFEGQRIGATGSFPPRTDSANIVPRLYPIPPRLLLTPGVKTLTIRVWHGDRSGSVFRHPPVLDELAAVEEARSRADQVLVFLLGLGLTLALVFFLFAFHARGSAEYPLFGVLCVAIALYAITIHSDWATAPLPKSTPFRLSVLCSMACSLVYGRALARLVRFELPRRWRLYDLFYALTFVAGLVLPVGALVFPMRLYPYVFAAALLELIPHLVRALREKRRRARPIAAGHVIFLLGIAGLAGFVPKETPLLGEAWVSISLLAAGFLILATTFLWAMSDQLTRFRVAALTDPGTRLWNRNALFEEIEERADQRRRGERSSFGLVLIDLDRFKELNDRKGHLAGDRLLIRVARALQDASRPGDFVARFGGDEFAVLLQGVDGETVSGVAGRLHEELLASVRTEADEVPVTVSLGAAVFSRRRHASAPDLFQDADHALYESKAAGKNRVTVFRSPGGSPSSGSFSRPDPNTLGDRLRRLTRGR